MKITRLPAAACFWLVACVASAGLVGRVRAAEPIDALPAISTQRVAELPDVPTVREPGAEPIGSTSAEQDAILKRQMDPFRPIIREVKLES